MSEHRATITIEIVDNEESSDMHISIGGELNSLCAAVLVARLREELIACLNVSEFTFDLLFDAAKKTCAKKSKAESARDKLYELLERLHAQKEVGKDGNEA